MQSLSPLKGTGKASPPPVHLAFGHQRRRLAAHFAAITLDAADNPTRWWIAFLNSRPGSPLERLARRNLARLGYAVRRRGQAPGRAG